VLGTIAGGMAYVRGTPTVATLLLLSLLTGLFGRSYGPLLAVFARDVFDVGSFPFGVLVAAPGLGTLVGSLGLAARRDVAAKGRWVLASTVGMSAALALFAVVPAYALALPLLLGAGLLGTVASALTATMLQLQAPPMLRGRVMSYYTLTLIGVPALGTLLLGAVADAVGVRAAVGAAAALLALLTVVTYRRGVGLRDGA
jgi:MFS family permease